MQSFRRNAIPEFFVALLGAICFVILLPRLGPAQTDIEAAKAASGRFWDGPQIQSQPLAVGAAAKIITPANDGKPWKHLYFAGFGRIESPKRNAWKWIFRGVRKDKKFYNTAQGIRDDLYARALVIKQDGKKIGIVVIDAVGLFLSDTEKIRSQVGDLGFDLIIVQATHNHSGPDTIGLWGPLSTHPLPLALAERLTGKEPIHVKDGKNPEFMKFLYAQAGAALREADKDAKEAHLYFGSSPVPEVNGKSVLKDLRAPRVFDAEVHALQARDLMNRPIATLANFGIHPEILGSRITQISADVSGGIARSLERRGGGIGLHANAAIGALVSPNDLYGYDDRKHPLPPSQSLALREKGLDAIGDIVSKTALESLPIEPSRVSRIGIAKRKIFVPLDNELLASAFKTNAVQRTLYTNGVLDAHGQDLLTEMDLVVLHGPNNEPLAEIFTIPGELAPEIYLGGFLTADRAANPQAPEAPILKNYLRAPHQYLMGLGDDELGYIIPLNDFVFPRGFHPGLPSKDQFGRKHYEETFAAGSQLSVIVSLNLIGMLQEYYEGKTELSPESVNLEARRQALKAFAGRKDAVKSLIKLYRHQPLDEVTDKAGEALRAMGVDISRP